MDARTADSPVISERDSWLQRERASGRFYDRLGWVIAAFLAGMMAFSVWVLRRGAEPGTLLSPPVIALLLIANLIPAIALMVLYSRRLAVRRAERGGLGSGRLHVRLVALFSVIASVPTLLVVIFASLLFQSGLDFWLSDRAQTVIKNAQEVAGQYRKDQRDEVQLEVQTMGKDVVGWVNERGIDDPQFGDFMVDQTARRGLLETALLTITRTGVIQMQGGVNLYDRPLEDRFAASTLMKLQAGQAI